MLRRICRACDSEVTRTCTPDGEVFFCETCEAETQEFDLVEMEPLCPDCGNPVEFCVRCGSGYYCSTCRALRSSKKIAWKRLPAGSTSDARQAPEMRRD